jgi:hypothetical protein
MIIGRVAERREGNFDGRERQEQDSLYWSRGDGDAGRSQSAIQQDLRYQSSKRMAHDDRSAIQLANDLLVVFHHFGHAKLRNGRRVSA